MSHWVNFNGSMTPAATPLVGAGSRAFRYGDGLFETMRADRGGVHLGDFHFDRLFAGMKTLQLSLPALVTAGELRRQIQLTIAKNAIAGDARVRLAVFRGDGGLYEPDGPGGGYVIEAWPIQPKPSLNENGLVLGVYEAAKKSCDLLANIKTSNFLVYVMAALHAKAQRWNDALVLNVSGRVADSTIANVFWVKDRTLYTPPLSEGGVAGVMRRHLLQRLPASGLVVREQPVSVAELENADELFLTNAITGIRWVRQFNDKLFSCSLTTSLYASTF